MAGEGIEEKGIDRAGGRTVVAVAPRYFRPTEVETLLGDPAKAKRKLDWQPKIGFRDLVREIMQGDLQDAKRDHLCESRGFRTYNFHE